MIGIPNADKRIVARFGSRRPWKAIETRQRTGNSVADEVDDSCNDEQSIARVDPSVHRTERPDRPLRK
jgi:hypothetical protein